MVKTLMKAEKRKQEQWYSNNCLNDKNLGYIEECLLTPNKINRWQNENKGSTWNVIADGTPYGALQIEKNTKIFKIEVEAESSSLVLKERNKSLMTNAKNKEQYHLENQAGENGRFYGLEPWEDVIEYIMRRR